MHKLMATKQRLLAGTAEAARAGAAPAERGAYSAEKAEKSMRNKGDGKDGKSGKGGKGKGKDAKETLGCSCFFFLCNVFDTFIMRIPYAYVEYSLSSLDWILFENLCLATSGLM